MGEYTVSRCSLSTACTRVTKIHAVPEQKTPKTFSITRSFSFFFIFCHYNYCCYLYKPCHASDQIIRDFTLLSIKRSKHRCDVYGVRDLLLCIDELHRRRSISPRTLFENSSNQYEGYFVFTICFQYN